MKKRILIFTTHFHPYKGGLENFVLELGTRLSKKKIIVDIFTCNTHGNKEIEKYRGITIYRFPSKSVLGGAYTFPKFDSKYKKLLKNILSNKYDAIFTNTRFFVTSYLGLIYSKKLNAKLIHIEHGNVHAIHKNLFVTAIAWIYDQIIGRKIFRKSDIVVGISKPCTEFAKRLGAKKTTVIHNSVDTNFFEIKKTDLRKKMGIAENDTVIINGIGRLIYAKGLQDVLEAVKNMKNIAVINIGEGPYKKELKKLSEKYKLKSFFPGKINRAELLKYLSIGDIFINPSYSEGLPTCVLEAGAAGLPVIATDVGGTREIIRNENEGILIKPKDKKAIKSAIQKMLNNKRYSEKISKNLKKYIKKNFDWEKNIDKFEELI